MWLRDHAPSDTAACGARLPARTGRTEETIMLKRANAFEIIELTGVQLAAVAGGRQCGADDPVDAPDPAQAPQAAVDKQKGRGK
jgi:hypothetical protein